MPIYVYRCQKCGDTIERMKNINKCDEEEYCSICKVEMEKVPARSDFKLEGGGWYQSGYTK